MEYRKFNNQIVARRVYESFSVNKDLKGLL